MNMTFSKMPIILKLIACLVVLSVYCRAAHEPAIPNIEMLGRSVRSVPKSLLLGSKEGIQPFTITLDLNRGWIREIVADYPETVSVEMIRSAVSKLLKTNPRHESAKLTVWRNERLKTSALLSPNPEDGTIQLLLRWFGTEGKGAK